MIERFLDELRRMMTANEATQPPELNEKLHSRSSSDEPILAVIPTVKKIVRRKLFSARQTDAPDVAQKVILQLLTWRENQPGKSEKMTAQEWQSFASKTTYHAVNRHLSSEKDLTESLDELHEIAGETKIFGNTAAEVSSLAAKFWQGICGLSLRQRRALLLGSESLIVILRLSGIGNGEISDVLELSEDELLEIINRLPLKDNQIAHLIVALISNGDAENRNIVSLTKSIKKARHEARAKLKKLISE